MADEFKNREEERQRLKQEFKKDFQLRQEFMEDLRLAQSKANVSRALNDMEAKTDDTDDWISRLNSLTAMQEAKSEQVLKGKKASKIQPEIDPIDSELMRLMKLELEARDGLIPISNPGTSTKTLADNEISMESETLKKSNAAANPDVSKKTLGDFEL